jgi:hypothetical protein
MPQFHVSFLAAYLIDVRCSVQWLVRQNFLYLALCNLVQGDVRFIVLIPVVPCAPRHILTVYIQCANVRREAGR